jgi:methionine-rich copper-binding protein CopC
VKMFATVLTCLLGAVLATLSPLNPAWGHATLVKSAPANGTILKQSPSEIRATFDDELAKGSILRLYDGHKKLLATGGFDPSVAKHTTLKISPPHLAPGSYVVQWYVISADDGATAKGSFRFSVAKGAMTPSGSMAGLPPIRLVAPTSRARVKAPVALLIDTPADISQFTMGDSMGTMSGMGPHVHLHMVVDGSAYMPTAGQLTKVGPARYAYRLQTTSAGAHTVKVYWADNKTHEPTGMVKRSHSRSWARTK